MTRAPRIFIGLNEVAGYYTSLATGFRRIGIRCTFVDERSNAFAYGPAGRFARAMRWVDPTGATHRSFARSVAKGLLRTILFIWAVARHDTFVITSGVSFFKGRDLLLLRALGKRVVVVFTGSDHRPAFLNGRFVAELPMAGVLAENDRLLRFVQQAERHASAIVALSSSAQLHRRPFVHLLAVGIPFDLPSDSEPTDVEPQAGRPVVIVHSPSGPEYKGTDLVRQTVADLSKRTKITYRELIGRPNSEVLAALADCDFVIDELYSDTPMARLATEAAYFGKPAVTCGYYATEIADDLDARLIPPSTFRHPSEFGRAVETFVFDNGARVQAGDAVRQFVRRQWSSEMVARRFLRVIEGSVPPEWLYDPSGLRYAHGWGMPESAIAAAGRDAIQMATPERLGIGPLVAARLAEIIARHH